MECKWNAADILTAILTRYFRLEGAQYRIECDYSIDTHTPQTQLTRTTCMHNIVLSCLLLWQSKSPIGMKFELGFRKCSITVKP